MSHTHTFLCVSGYNLTFDPDELNDLKTFDEPACPHTHSESHTEQV